MSHRVTTLRTMVLLTGGSTYVTALRLSAFLSVEDPATRVTSFKLGVYADDHTHGIRVTTLRLGVYADDHTHGINVTTLRAAGWVSLKQGLYLAPPFGGNEVFVPEVVNQLVPDEPLIPILELNPHHPDMPGDDLQRILRDQHNKTQAGDTTFHWGILTEISATPQFNLGSIGRVFHDDYGVIVARYCKFVDWVETLTAATPVGLRLSPLEPWVVTNRFEKSNAASVVGIAIPYNKEILKGEWYGWVVTEGLLPTEVNVHQTSQIALFGDQFGWYATGLVAMGVDGPSIGTRHVVSKNQRLQSGQFKVLIEPLSQAKLTGQITTQIAPLQSQLDQSAAEIATITNELTLQASDVARLDQRINQTNENLAREVRSISFALKSIRDVLGVTVVTQSYVDSGDNQIRAETIERDKAIQDLANRAWVRADEAYRLAESGPGSSILAQIEGLNTGLSDLQIRLTGFTVNIDDIDNPQPLNGGEVLVSTFSYTDDVGLDHYVFSPVEFKLENLTDVDLDTTPPSNGDALVWDGVNNTWIPFALGGGLSDAPADGKLYGRKDATWEEVTGGGGGGSTAYWGWGFDGLAEPASISGTTTAALGSGAINNALRLPWIGNHWWWNTGQTSQTITFDFGSATVISGIMAIQNNGTGQGVWQVQWSDDGSTYTNIGSSATWAGTQMVWSFANSTAHRYWRLTQLSGSTSNSPWQQGFLFRWGAL